MNSKKFQNLLNAPLPLKISDRDPLLRRTLLGTAGMLICLLHLRELMTSGYVLNNASAWDVLFWSVMFLLFLWCIFFPKEKSLTITPEGFTVASPKAQQTYQWNSVSEFQSHFYSANRGYVVTFNDHAGEPHELTETYRLTDDQLAQLLNQRRDHAISKTQPST